VTHPGTELHDELLLFVQGGLTSMEALQAATSDPARFLRQSDRIGTVTLGKEADLLLLDRDPLADIANTRAIDTVILRGRVLDRKELDAMKAAEK
jgi:imidazolonepropionase-like amidohydrolase